MLCQMSHRGSKVTQRLTVRKKPGDSGSRVQIFFPLTLSAGIYFVYSVMVSFIDKSLYIIIILPSQYIVINRVHI